MFKIWLFYIVIAFFMMIGVVFGHHKNEKYAFDNLYKYSIKKSENAVAVSYTHLRAHET